MASVLPDHFHLNIISGCPAGFFLGYHCPLRLSNVLAFPGLILNI